MSTPASDSGNTLPVATSPVAPRYLSIDDIFSGGDNRLFRFPMPDITTDGQPGYLYLRQPSTVAAFEYFERATSVLDDGSPGKLTNNMALLKLVAECVCDREGNLQFAGIPLDTLATRLPIRTFYRLAQAAGLLVNGENPLDIDKPKPTTSDVTAKETVAGKDSSGVLGSDLPTA